MRSQRQEKSRLFRMSRYERRLWKENFSAVAGVDEAGRGPLAGPVVAAAVILPQNIFIPGLDDSKRLGPKRREELFSLIKKQAKAVGVGMVNQSTIDRINILQATFLAMGRAVAKLRPLPEYVLVDGLIIPDIDIFQLSITGGDRLSISIAAASIVAKVTRDRIMVEEDKHLPQYGFASHKGYATRRHLEALARYGVSPLHRRSFRPVRETTSKFQRENQKSKIE
ncbi:ribonuclease HII [bacterium]|nr:ribonuclease HII [bacterium]